jgi:hypothetical protein
VICRIDIVAPTTALEPSGSGKKTPLRGGSARKKVQNRVQPLATALGDEGVWADLPVDGWHFQVRHDGD